MARNIDSGRLSVMLWGQEIGQLCWNPAKGNSYFYFSPEYLSSGLDIAPLTASSKSPAARFAIYGNTDSAKYQKLPPFIADSLPDDWGNTLFDQWFAEHHYHEKDKTPLAKLSFVGSRAMGALEFIPCSEDAFSPNERLMIPKLYDLAKKIEQDREHAIISPEETLTQKALMAVGTSAGGRFKKAIIAMDEGGNIFSGQTSARGDRKYYILKFNTPEFCLSEIEKTWYDLATRAGITMMPSRLIEVEGISHFLTERFDRHASEKVFTQTLAAVNPEAYCYEDLFSTCRQLSIPQDELNELFLRMVFNLLSNNTDDHAKNFSFIMEKDGSWHLSPAYDLCFILKTATGLRPLLHLEDSDSPGKASRILRAREVRGYNHRGPAGLCRPERYQESREIHRQGYGSAQGLPVPCFSERCRLSLRRHHRVTAARTLSGCLRTGCRHFGFDPVRDDRLGKHPPLCDDRRPGKEACLYEEKRTV